MFFLHLTFAPGEHTINGKSGGEEKKKQKTSHRNIIQIKEQKLFYTKFSLPEPYKYDSCTYSHNTYIHMHMHTPETQTPTE